MARPLSPEKKENFLAAALRLFVKHGVQNTSTNQIAKEAGTATGTLFLYFPTKQSLINELVLKISKEQADRINARLSPALSAQESFLAIWEESINWFLENPEGYQYIRQVRDSGMIDEETVMKSARYFAFYYETIQKGLDEQSIQTYPIDLIGGFLYQGIIAVMNYLMLNNKPENTNETIQTGFNIFWNGISEKGS